MTEQDNMAIVRRIVEDYKGQSIKQAPLQYLAENIEWLVSGSIDDPFTGRYSGLQQVEHLFATFCEMVTVEKYNPKEYIAQGDKVVVSGNEAICFKVSNRTVKCTFVYIMTIRDGKIVKWQTVYGYP
jgi:uncharacterized protein